MSSEQRDFFVHDKGLCESEHVGRGTRVWAFAHVLPRARIGQDCNICDNVFVENDVVIGNRVTLKCGVQVWDGITLEDDVFVGPNVTFTNDPFPRSRKYPEQFARTVVRRGASLGANSTILPGVTIGMSAMIGAGAVVTRSVPPNAIVVGNPARIVGYVNAKATSAVRPEKRTEDLCGPVAPTSVEGVCLYQMKSVADIRGNLSVGEFERDIPFPVKRYFLVYDVKTQETRGEHAHLNCHQFLVAVKGSVNVLADDGRNREEFVLNRPTLGVHLPPMTWGVQYRYSPDAVLLVLASHYYDANDYIRNYDQFVKLVESGAEQAQLSVA